jgi:hypothetical protein
LFFTTFMALVLFWAEIIHHAKHHERSRLLRPLFLAFNAIMYALETVLIVLVMVEKSKPVEDHIVIGQYDLIDQSYFCALSLLIAIGFLFYGWRLFALLKSNPISSQGRTAKLREVGSVTAICVTCFTLRATMKVLMITAPFRNLLVYSWAFLLAFYVVAEVAPALLVLFVLRKMPPRYSQKAVTTSGGVPQPYLPTQQPQQRKLPSSYTSVSRSRQQ